MLLNSQRLLRHSQAKMSLNSVSGKRGLARPDMDEAFRKRERLCRGSAEMARVGIARAGGIEGGDILGRGRVRQRVGNDPRRLAEAGEGRPEDRRCLETRDDNV